MVVHRPVLLSARSGALSNGRRRTVAAGRRRDASNFRRGHRTSGCGTAGGRPTSGSTAETHVGRRRTACSPRSCSRACSDERDATSCIAATLVFAILNAFPYAAGHMLVLPYREVADLEDLDRRRVRRAVGDGHRRGACREGGVQPGRRQRRAQPRPARRRQHQRAPARARRAAVGRRRQLHDGHRQHPHAAGGAAPTRRPSCAPHGPGSLTDAMSDTEDAHATSLPDDLNASEYVGPYQFPDNSRRRRPAYLYFGDRCGLSAAVVLATRSTTPCWSTSGMVVGGHPVGAVGVLSFTSGWRMHVDEKQALVAAQGAVGFAVGHASAQQVWRGLRSRPTWRVLVYSAESPPRQRSWCWSTRSTARSSSTSPRTTPKRTGRTTSRRRRRCRPRRRCDGPQQATDVEGCRAQRRQRVDSSQSSAGTASIASAIAAGSGAVCISLAAIAICSFNSDVMRGGDAGRSVADRLA